MYHGFDRSNYSHAAYYDGIDASDQYITQLKPRPTMQSLTLQRDWLYQYQKIAVRVPLVTSASEVSIVGRPKPVCAQGAYCLDSSRN